MLNKKTVLKVAYLVCIFALLVFPITKMNKEKVSKVENRNLAVFPMLRNSEGKINLNYGREFEKYLSDRYRYRDRIVAKYIQANRLINNRIDNDLAMEGKDKWLFYKAEGSIHNFLDNNLFSEEQLSVIKTNVETRERYLKKLGIKYYLFIAPDKNQVYGDFYPSYIQKVGVHGGRGKQVYDYLKKNGFVNVIYPLEELMQAKSEGMLYYKNDTHWNEMGGFIGYTQLMKMCVEDFPNLQYLKLEDMKVSLKTVHGGDLAKMLQVEDAYNTDVEYPFLTKRDGYAFEYKENRGTDGVYTINPVRNINAVFLRDSFTIAMLPYVSETFGNVKYIWQYDFVGNLTAIKTEKPQIVVSQFVERSVHALVYPDPVIKEDI